jgi:lauroyl/myristoyl acyltransferase
VKNPAAALVPARQARADLFRHDGALLRSLASFGARYAPHALRRALPPAFGVAFAMGMPALRARVRSNLRRMAGSQTFARESADVARTFAHFASCLTEGMAMARTSPPHVALDIDGEAHLRAVLDARAGAILVTAHTGGWEVAGPLLAETFGVEIVIAMRREPNARGRAIQDLARARSGVRVVHVDGEPLAALPLFTHLRRGGIVGVQIDRAPGGSASHALPLPLFGLLGRVPSGPFELARVTGAKVVPVFARRVGYLHYEVSISPPIDVPRRASRDELTHAGARAVVAMEAFLSAHPTHWFDFGD